MSIRKLTLALFLLLAFLGGVAAATLAQGSIAGTYWYSGADLMRLPRSDRLVYAAGAHDMLAAVLSVSTLDAETAVQILIRADTCIDQRSGGTLGQFTDWAESIWRGRRESAAKLLLLDACR